MLTTETWSTVSVMPEGPGQSILFDLEIPDGLKGEHAFRQFIAAIRRLAREGAFIAD